MPDGSSKRQTQSSLVNLIDDNLSKNLKLNELSTDSINLLNLLTLIVDIEYRRKYGGSIDWQDGRGYSKRSNDDLADQLSPIDEYESASSPQWEAPDNEV